MSRSTSQNGLSNTSTSLFRSPNPILLTASRFHCGSGGSNCIVCALRTPRGALKTTLSATKDSPSSHVITALLLVPALAYLILLTGLLILPSSGEGYRHKARGTCW